MPAFNRFVISGTLASGAEIWSTSCAFTDFTNGPVILANDLKAWTDAVNGVWGTTWTGGALGAALGGNASITAFTAYYYPSTTGPAAAVGETTTTWPGAGTGNQPLQSSAVLSLRTGVAGRRYRGRMYWPALALAPSNFGTYQTSAALGLAQDAAEHLAVIADAAPVVGAFEPVVVSAAADEITSVIEVAVGNVPDTQRRRRNSLIETYQTAAI